MESKVNYTLVGLFVLVFITALIVLSLWLGAGASGKHYNTYITYMYESVSGLNADAPVRYLGVDVGEVQSIALDRNNPERVKLFLIIERGTPIKQDTVATLAMQGITGLALIELTGGTKKAPPIKPHDGPPYPVIKSSPSLLTRMDVAVTEMMERMTEMSAQFNQVAEKFNGLLNDDNLQAADNLIANLDRVIQVIGEQSENIEKNLDNVTIILENAATASERMPQIVENVDTSTQGIEQMAATANRAAEDFERILALTENELIKPSGNTITQASQLMTELRELTASLDRVVDQFERNPAMIIQGRSDTLPGPGEQRR